jgi:hypothetical protein
LRSRPLLSSGWEKGINDDQPEMVVQRYVKSSTLRVGTLAYGEFRNRVKF